VGTKHELPFDYCCPSLQDLLGSRTCEKCGIYHATKKSLIAHRRICKINGAETDTPHSTLNGTQSAICKRVRPLRVAAQRQKEKMIIWTSRLNDKHVDWFDEDEVELGIDQDTNVSVENDTSVIIPVIEMDDYMQPIWQ
jgi:hypothetical protein